MYASAVRYMIRRSVRALNAGDIQPALNGYSSDATFVFPGDSSWGGEYRGRDAIQKFLQRFVKEGLKLEPLEIAVSGWPWNTTVCMRFTDEARDPEGNIVYSNRGIAFARAAWGRIRHQEDYLDTQKAAEFDEYLASRQPGAT